MQIHIKWKVDAFELSLPAFIDLVIDHGHTINSVVVTKYSLHGNPLSASIIATKRED
jgi:hypothetical protein